MSIERTMYEEAEKQFVEIGKMELGSDQYVKTVNGATDIVDRLNELEKIKNEKRKLDIEEKKIEVENARLDRSDKADLFKNVMTGVTFVASLAVTVWGYVDSKRFEQGYTHTTEAGRASTRKLLSFLDRVKN